MKMCRYNNCGCEYAVRYSLNNYKCSYKIIESCKHSYETDNNKQCGAGDYRYFYISPFTVGNRYEK